MMRPRDVLEHYVKRHNSGVRSGDFAPLLEMLEDDALLEFRGVALGPFDGKPAIARAFAEHPPSDELVLLSVTEPDLATGDGEYAWHAQPGTRAGTLHVELRHMRIARLVVSVSATPATVGVT